MFPTLYDAADSLGGLGYGRLSDAIYCHVREERNGAYELEMQYPITGLHYDDIVLQRIIVAKPNGYSLPQRFRIREISRPINGVVTIYANHISYDLSGVPVAPFTAYSATAAMTGLVTESIEAHPFTTWTDISSVSQYTQLIPRSFRACLGGEEGSILDVYGGEFEFDNYVVKLWAARGTNRGVRITYGKNLTDIEQDENCAEVYTGVYPYYYNSDTGEYVELTEKIIQLIVSPDVPRVLMLDLTEDFEDKPSEADLRSDANKYISSHDLATPAVSLTVSFEQLQKTDEYKDAALLEEIRLCDTVTVLFPALGVNATSKCISYDYDVLAERFESIELGSARADLADTIVQNARDAEQAPQIALNMIGSAIQNATQTITGNLGGHVVLHSSNGDDIPDEILILIDSDDIATVTKLWRWNAAGLGFSSTGYNGTYDLAMTSDGSIVADMITAGQLNGSIIMPGTIYFDNLADDTKAYIVGEVDGLRTEVSSDLGDLDDAIRSYIDQKADSIDIRFQSVEQSMAAGDDANADAIQEISSHILIESNKMTFLLQNNPYKLVLTNTGIQVLGEGDVAVCEFTANGVLLPQETVIPLGGTLQMGNFKWTPRSSGNLSMVKV